jgi:hypothetical protein
MKNDGSNTLPVLAFMGGTKAMTLTRSWTRRSGPVNRIASSFQK